MAEFALADLFETVVRAVPDRECIVQGARRLRYAEVHERVQRLASWFAAHGLGQVRERVELEPWQSGQDHVALYLSNCPEYIESMLACFRARLVPFNVNYRYTVPELVSLLRDAGARALVYHAAFDAQVSALRAELPELGVLVRVGAPGEADDYAAAIADGDPAGPIALHALCAGDTVVLPVQVRRFDPEEALDTIERERIDFVTLIGDAFGRPLLEALERRSAQLSSLRAIVNGGAPLGADTKRALLARLPGRVIIDAIGSSESGTQGIDLGTESNTQTGRFERIASTSVLSADRSRVLPAGDPELGWLAQSGRVPLGYLGDPERTRATFPVLDGVRWAVPGDRAYVLADGRLEVVGRDSTTINSGGEKIFAEEVEAVLKTHPAVYDVLVCSRPSPRWGQEVCAVVQLRASADAATVEAELLAHAARELARYKLPRAFVFCERIERSPSGKPDYAWARQRVVPADS